MKNFVIVPARNEERRLDNVLERIQKTDRSLKIIVVDDFSSDRTGAIAKSHGAAVIKPQRHEGVGLATITGLKYALLHGADIIVFMDADGQHRPEDIKKFVQPIENEGYDFVIGERDLSRYPLMKKFGNFGLRTLSKVFTPTGINDPECGFRAISSDAAKKLHLKASKYNICMDFVYNIWRYKLRIKQVKINVPVYYTEKGTTAATGFQNGMFLVKRRILG